MLKTIRTTLFALLLASGTSVFTVGTAHASVPAPVGIHQSGTNNCSGIFAFLTCVAIGANATNNCVNIGGHCIAVSTRSGSATNNCINIGNSSCTATAISRSGN